MESKFYFIAFSVRFFQFIYFGIEFGFATTFNRKKTTTTTTHHTIANEEIPLRFTQHICLVLPLALWLNFYFIFRSLQFNSNEMVTMATTAQRIVIHPCERDDERMPTRCVSSFTILLSYHLITISYKIYKI